nr:hypothetical protein [Tanacetum cinerariifolium]
MSSVYKYQDPTSRSQCSNCNRLNGSNGLEVEAVQIILTGIDNDIYSTVDACPNAYEMWKAIERLKQGESINVQDLETNLFWEFGKFTSLDGESLESYYSRFYKLMNELTRNKHVKGKEIDKLMALISLSFKKIYKPTNNNLRTSSNTSRANQDNSPRIHRNAGYEGQRSGTIAGARDTRMSEAEEGKRCSVSSSDDQELEAHYMYMAKLQQVSPDVDDSGPIFDKEPEEKIQNGDDYDVLAIDCQHSEQSESVHNTYLIEQDALNVLIESEDMTYDSEQIEQNDEDVDLAKEHELLASLISKLKCEIDETKNRNTLLESSNKILVEKLNTEIADFKNKNKSLTEANNKL